MATRKYLSKREAAKLVRVEPHADSGFWLRVAAHAAMPSDFRHLNYLHCRSGKNARALCRAIRAAITRPTLKGDRHAAR